MHTQNVLQKEQKVEVISTQEESSVLQFNVLNLSACTLSKGQINVLSKGLNFVPAKYVDLFQTCKDVNKLVNLDESTTNTCYDLNQRGRSICLLETMFQDVTTVQVLDDLQYESVSSLGDAVPPCAESTANCMRFPNKDFYPVQCRTKEINTFQHMVEQELRMIDANSAHNTYNNLTREEYRSLKLLSNNPYITICAADKEGSTVV